MARAAADRVIGCLPHRSQAIAASNYRRFLKTFLKANGSEERERDTQSSAAAWSNSDPPDSGPYQKDKLKTRCSVGKPLPSTTKPADKNAQDPPPLRQAGQLRLLIRFEWNKFQASQREGILAIQPPAGSMPLDRQQERDRSKGSVLSRLFSTISTIAGLSGLLLPQCRSKPKRGRCIKAAHPVARMVSAYHSMSEGIRSQLKVHDKGARLRGQGRAGGARNRRIEPFDMHWRAVA